MGSALTLDCLITVCTVPSSRNGSSPSALMGFATASNSSAGSASGEDETEEDAAAAARRAVLLARYGDRTSSEPVAVNVSAVDAETAAKNETDHNEIWGDCESVRTMLRPKIFPRAAMVILD